MDPRWLLTLIDRAIDATESDNCRRWEKAEGEWVTERDLAIEDYLGVELLTCSPGSRLLGEEGAGEDPSWPRWMQRGHVWVVDPLDGTANYVSGDGRWATMISLLVDGRPQLSCIRVHGGPALIVADGALTMIGISRRVIEPDRRPRGRLSGRFLPAGPLSAMRQVLEVDWDVLDGSGCAGADYLDLLAGELDFLIYERVLPWDHIAGAHAVSVQGGMALTGNGVRYQGQPDAVGLVVSTNELDCRRLEKVRRRAMRTPSR